jgi:formate dehydrogenase subunit delta
MSTSQHLVQMANDIGNFFRAQPIREDAIIGIENHIKSFWTPRMRDKLCAELEKGDIGLDELPREALSRLSKNPCYKPDQPPGGDAG